MADKSIPLISRWCSSVLWHRNRSSAVKLEFETETAAGDLLPARESGLPKVTIVAICLLIVRPGLRVCGFHGAFGQICLNEHRPGTALLWLVWQYSSIRWLLANPELLECHCCWPGLRSWRPRVCSERSSSPRLPLLWRWVIPWLAHSD